MKHYITLNEDDITRMVRESIRSLNEDITRGTIEDEIKDYTKSKDFEKAVHNIVVDTMREFIENMWTRKSYWATMLKKK